MDDSAAPLLQRLGQRVRAARSQQGWTLQTLAEESGVSRRFLGDLEAGRGNISVARLAQVGQALQVSVDRLLCEDRTGSAVDEVLRQRLLFELDGLDHSGMEEAIAWCRSRKQADAARKFALIGLRGAGKTTIGQQAAARIGLPFIELDQRVEEAAGMSLTDLFGFHGEPYYRRLEREVLATVLRRRGGAVLAASGGIVHQEETWSLLKDSCYTVWLEARPEDHWGRVVAQGDRRPMRGKPQAMAELRTLLDRRRPLYSQAHRSIDTSELGLDGSVEAVCAAISGR